LYCCVATIQSNSIELNRINPRIKHQVPIAKS
jgi:hypothetical protein